DRVLRPRRLVVPGHRRVRAIRHSAGPAPALRGRRPLDRAANARGADRPARDGQLRTGQGDRGLRTRRGRRLGHRQSGGLGAVRSRLPDQALVTESGRMTGMQKISLQALARTQLELAAAASSGRSAQTVYGGHEQVLRQTLIAMTAGTSLSEHENPGAATVHVLSGRVRLAAGNDSWDGREGDLIVIPPARHSLHAVENAVVLLTVAKHD